MLTNNLYAEGVKIGTIIGSVIGLCVILYQIHLQKKQAKVADHIVELIKEVRKIRRILEK